MSRREAGFTLIELMVVVLIIGILAAFAIPQYLKSVETSKADDAVALMNMVATTNRMYALDHANNFVHGMLDNTCTTGGACSNNAATGPCELVNCKYLASQDFNSKSYVVAADDPGGNTVCSTGNMGTQTVGAPFTACTIRKTSSNAGALSGSPAGSVTGVGSYSPYTGWGYGVNTTGQVYSVGTNTPSAISQ